MIKHLLISLSAAAFLAGGMALPAQAAGPVNFLVYPYVEVDGRQHTSFEKRFRYEDVD